MFRTSVQERWARIGAASGIAAGILLVGAWADVLPGGWRLRGLVEAHDAREGRERALHAAERLREFAREDPRANAGSDTIVFVGSSTIERCPIETLFPGVNALNRGIGWAGSRELATHLDRLLSGTPRAIVLYAGSPDRIDDPLDVEGVLSGIESLATAVRERVPSAPVLLLGLLPATTTCGPEAEAFARIEAGIARIAAEFHFEHVGFVGSALIDERGALREVLSTDGLHLNDQGYAIFAERLRGSPGLFASLLAP